jgi:acylphosphatase
MSDLRIKVKVEGRVQGVFFRETLRAEAERRGVRGSATNLPDGSVEAVFEGADHDVRAMVELARRGPAAARVDRLTEQAEEPVGDAGEFVTR